MKFLPLISLIGLALTIIPPLIHLLGDFSEKTTFTLMSLGMVIWYLAATPWLLFQKPEFDDSTRDQI